MAVHSRAFRMSSGMVGTHTDLAAQLERARRVVERHFLAAGKMLTQAIEGIDALVASLEKLVEALDAKAVAAASDDLRAAAQSLNDLADNHHVRQLAIEELGRRRETLAKFIGDMRSSLAYMRAFTVNIKIVSSGIAEAGSLRLPMCSSAACFKRFAFSPSSLAVDASATWSSARLAQATSAR